MAVNAGQRNVPDTPQNQQLQACTKAKELALHTLAICKNKNVFTEDYKNILTDDIVETAKDVFVYAFSANDIRVVRNRCFTDIPMEPIIVEKPDEISGH